MLSEKAIKAIKGSEPLKGKLAGALRRSVSSVNRWLYDNETIMLTTATALQIIREETGMTDAEILSTQEASR